MEIKTKGNKWDLLKLKSIAKETISKMKKQPTNWEKIFANNVTNKGFISKIYKLLMTLNSITTNNPIKKMGQRPKQTFLQRRHTDVQHAHEKMLILLIIRETQIKTIMKYNLTPARMAIIKKSTNNKKFWRGYGVKETLLPCWWGCRLVQPLWRLVQSV